MNKTHYLALIIFIDPHAGTADERISLVSTTAYERHQSWSLMSAIMSDIISATAQKRH